MKQVFGYFRLETGVKFCGWFNLVLNLASFAYTVYEIVSFYSDDSDRFYSSFMRESIGNVILILIAISSNVALIYGVTKRLHYFLIPWMVIYGIILPCVTFVCLVNVMFFRMDGKFYITLILLVIQSVLIYLWFAAFSLLQIFYKENKAARNRLDISGVEFPA